MTRKHYRFFAKFAAESNLSEHRINEMCDFFLEDNRAFRKAVFMNAYWDAKEAYDAYNEDLKELLKQG
jgi:hypothetical protein